MKSNIVVVFTDQTYQCHCLSTCQCTLVSTLLTGHESWKPQAWQDDVSWFTWMLNVSCRKIQEYILQSTLALPTLFSFNVSCHDMLEQLMLLSYPCPNSWEYLVFLDGMIDLMLHVLAAMSEIFACISEPRMSLKTRCSAEAWSECW